MRFIVYFNFFYMADFSFKMNNKRIIEFGFRRDLGLNSSDILLSLIYANLKLEPNRDHLSMHVV